MESVASKNSCHRALRFVAVLAVLTPVVAGPAIAQGLNLSGAERSRLDTVRAASRVIDGRLSEQYSASVRLLPKSAAAAASTNIPRYNGAYNGAYLELARAAARRHNIPEDLFLRLVHQESRWNSGAISSKGAIGLAQLMPGTAQMLRVDPNDPQQNLEGGARYLRMMFDKFGDWRLALAAYNAGPGKVEQHGGIPPYAETRDYVRIILGAG
jgi:soluble lytic murein transglycosylase-like protein